MKPLRLLTPVIACGMPRCLRPAVLAGLIVGLALLLQAAPVLAHADLARAEPAPNSVLAEPPSRVIIWFTEPLAPQFSSIEVLDAQGVRVDNGDSVVDANDPVVMSVSLPPLPNGIYTVAWRNLSTVDGHALRGSFVFSVGEPIAPGTAPAPQADVPLFQSPTEPVFRWLVLLSAVAVVGGLAFELLVLMPVFSGRDAGPGLRQLVPRLASNSMRLTWMALAVFFVASLGHLIAQASYVAEVSPLATIGGPVASIVADTDWGLLWLWRFVLFVAAGVILGVAARRGRSVEPSGGGFVLPRALALAIGMWALLTLTLASHAAATPEVRGPAIFNDYLHLLGVAVWVGGLFHLALATPVILRSLSEAERREALSGLVPRFSVVAVLSVGVLAITGLYSAWVQVTVVQALQTPYGLTLLAKAGLAAFLLLLGAANLLWVRPRLKGEDRAAFWLRRLVWGEAALAVLVLLSVGFLTSMEPARQTATREGIGQQQSLSFRDAAEGTHIHLELVPGRVGPNRAVVSLEDDLGRPITNATDVRLRLAYLGADLGEQPVSATSLGDGSYVVEEGLISIAGPWQAELSVQRPDAFDARTAFRFEVGTAGAEGSPAIAPSRETALLLWGLELAALGLLFLIVGIPLGGWYSRRGMAVMAPGVGAVLAGVVLIANTQFGDVQPGEIAVNPFPPDQESLAIGHHTYGQHCLACHGVEGRGDGPAAAGLNPPPADLQLHVPLHTDRQLFGFIRDGVPGTAMPAFRDRLSDDEIWHVINYLKTLDQ